MKRLNNIYSQITSIDNLRIAEAKARKGKANQYGVKIFDKEPESNIFKLHEMLLNKGYKTSEYEGLRLDLQIKINDVLMVTWTSSEYLIQMINDIPVDGFPFKTVIKEINEHYEFT